MNYSIRDRIKLIGLCGVPKSGKSEVQKILKADFGFIPVDDGAPLRNFCIDNLGFTEEMVNTQEGKLRRVTILDREHQVRKILGELGNKLEDLFGQNIMPYMATRNLDPNECYSFGSVRRRQGDFYRNLGGFVIGVRNIYAHPTGNEFDQFDESVVDVWIQNDYRPGLRPVAEAYQMLRAEVHVALLELFALQARERAA